MMDKIREIAEELFGTMRDLTEDERKAYQDYIDSISKPTGLSIWDLYKEEIDKVKKNKLY